MAEFIAGVFVGFLATIIGLASVPDKVGDRWVEKYSKDKK